MKIKSIYSKIECWVDQKLGYYLTNGNRQHQREDYRKTKKLNSYGTRKAKD